MRKGFLGGRRESSGRMQVSMGWIGLRDRWMNKRFGVHAGTSGI
jgi:hypothetical protein